mgnify:CR=1 FL=1
MSNENSNDMLELASVEPTLPPDCIQATAESCKYRKREYVSISSLCAFARCPRKYFYSSGCGLVSVAGDHTALSFGEAIHRVLPLVTTAGLHAAIDEFSKIWVDREHDPLRTVQTAIGMLTNFAETHQSSNLYELIKPPPTNIQYERVSEYEVPFALALPGVPIPLVGRIDGMCRRLDEGQDSLADDGPIWALEYKTGREVSSRLFDCFLINPQVICYSMALKVLTGREVRGTIVEALRVTSTKTRNYETLACPIYVLPHHYDMFVRWVQFQVGQLLAMESRNDFPQDVSACTTYPQFGMPGFTCEYLSLCQFHEDWRNGLGAFAIKSRAPFVLQDT